MKSNITGIAGKKLDFENGMGPAIMEGSVDPSAGAGLAAGIGSIYMRTNGEEWKKTSSPDTGWVNMDTVRAQAYFYTLLNGA